MAGFHGSHVGVIDLHLDRTAAGRWSVIAQSPRALPVDGAPLPATGPDPFLDALAAVPHQRLLADIRREIGRTAIPLHGFFSLVTPDLTLQVVADAQRARARTLLEGRPEAALPLLSAVSPFHAGGRAGPGAYVDIAAGPLCRRHASELYVYPNRLCIIAVTGAVVADWLEHVAGMFRRITPGETVQPLIDPAFPSYLFDVIDGLTYRIDPAAPARYDPAGRLIDARASRIRDLCRDGRPLDPAEPLLVVTNSYRAGGGGGAQALAEARLVIGDDRGVRDSVLAHLSGPGPLSPVLRRTWDFADHPGTGAWFDTGPTALRRTAPPGVTPLGPAPGGFHRFSQSFDPARHRQPGPPQA
jgi:2',3'-cyclic-nucleotide 2'-phosphodiesterase/3'-nucleotidase